MEVETSIINPLINVIFNGFDVILLFYFILFYLLLPLATIENFNVVETLSENAVIVYQTHKVRATS